MSIPKHLLMDPEAEYYTLLGALMKVLGIPVSGIPNKDSLRNLSEQQYQRLQESLWLLDQSCTQVLAQLVMNKSGEQGRSIYLNYMARRVPTPEDVCIRIPRLVAA